MKSLRMFLKHHVWQFCNYDIKVPTSNNFITNSPKHFTRVNPLPKTVHKPRTAKAKDNLILFVYEFKMS